MEMSAGVAHSYTGMTEVVGGTLLVEGSMTGSSVRVAPEGILRGSGTTGPLALEGGVLAPGSVVPGALQTGSLTLEGGTASFRISSDESFARLVVTGGVSLNAPVALAIQLDYRPSEGTSFALVQNDGSDAVQFLNDSARFTIGGQMLQEGSQFYVDSPFGGQNFSLTYGGGAGGNDVLLLAIPEPCAASLLAGGLLALLSRRRARTSRKA
jgi:autotransporter-associated beta strand protein